MALSQLRYFDDESMYQNPNFIKYYSNALQQAKKPAPSSAAPQKPPSKRGSGNKSWLSSIISELGGGGGAVGGAAAGAALGSVVPGIGNIAGGIIGGIAGGFLGGTGGRLAENKIRDNEYRLGDALKEGTWSGVFGGVGPAWQGARGISALGKASGNLGAKGGLSVLSSMSDDAAKAVAQTGKSGLLSRIVAGNSTDAALAGKAIVKSGAKAGTALGQGLMPGTDEFARATQKGLQYTGSQMRQWNRGTSVPGFKGLKPEQAREVNMALDSVNKWFGGINKTRQFTNLDDAVKALGKEYANSPESKQAFKSGKQLVQLFNQNIATNPSISSSLDDAVKGANVALKKDLEKRAASFKTNKDFLDFVSEQVNKRYRDMVSKTGAQGSKETQIYEAFRTAAKDIIDNKLPDKSGVNKQFAKLLNADDLLKQAITTDVTSGNAQGLNLGRLISNVAGPTADVAGRGLQQAGKVTKYTTPALGVALAANAMDPAAQSQEQSNSQALDEQTQESPQGEDYLSSLADPTVIDEFRLQEQSQGAGTGFSRDDLIASVQNDFATTGGKNVEKYISLYKILNEESGNELTAVQKNKVAGYQTANEVLGQLEQLWQNVNQPSNQAAAGVSGLPGIKQVRSTVDPNVRQYTQFAEGTLAPVIKSLGETGVLTDRDIIRAYGLVPNLQDSPAVAAQKIVQLRQLLTGAQQATVYGGGGSTTDELSNLIMQGAYQ